MYSFAVLGGALLESPAGPVRGRAAHRRRLALLAVLAAAGGRTVARERLLGLLWPEHPAQAARHLLAESLYILRKELGEGVIVSVGDEVGLREGALACDLTAFERAVAAGELETAAGFYRGPFLDGFYVSEALEFERWAEEERTRLRTVYGAVLERLAEGDEASGRYRAAAEWWRRLSLLDPYSSRIVLRRMQALEAGGERLQALRVAADHAAFLRDELGAEPDVELTGFLAQLRAAPPRRGPAPPPPSEVAGLPASGEDAAPSAAEPGEPVASVAPDPADNPPPAPSPVAGTGADVPAQRVQVRPSIPAIVGLVAVFLALTVASLAQRREMEHDRTWASDLDPRRIAVLYLEDLSSEQDLQPLSAALTESLISQLAQVEGLRVVSRHGVRPYRGRDVPLDTIARALRVGTIIGGSVRRSGSRVRITVQAVDVASGASLETREVEMPSDDVFAIEDSIGSRVGAYLKTALGVEIRLRQRDAGTRSARAREMLARAEERADEAARMLVEQNPLGGLGLATLLDAADSLGRAAAAADPRWSDARVLLGRIALMRAQSADIDTLRAMSALRAAVDHAEDALALRPGDAAAREVRGTAFWSLSRLTEGTARGDSLVNLAERDLTQALALDPALARGWATLSQLLRLGRGSAARADAAARRALAADEYLLEAPLVIERLYRSAYSLARPDSAALWCARGRARFPNDWRFVDCRLTLMGYQDGEAPDVALAWRLHDEAGQLDPPDAARTAGRAYFPYYRKLAVARVLARAEMRDSARVVLETVRREIRNDPALVRSFLYDEAYLRHLLGDPDDIVIALLERYAARSPRYREFLASDVQFRALRTHPRYRELIGDTTTLTRR